MKTLILRESSLFIRMSFLGVKHETLKLFPPRFDLLMDGKIHSTCTKSTIISIFLI